jgi:23S rRNA (guanosine2251-2'-O)-methyltransferase
MRTPPDASPVRKLASSALATTTDVVNILSTNMRNRKPFRKSSPAREAAPDQPALGGAYWIYGYHAVTAAIANPHRRFRRLAGTAAALAEHPLGRPAERLDPPALASLLPAGSVHQGLAALVEPLPFLSLEELLDDLPEGPQRLVILDQVTDPQNVGAVLRSASAFAAAGLILTERHAAPESGALAKAASGALDHLPMIRVVNLARAIETVKRAGFWCVGLAAEAELTIAAAKLAGRTALVLGAEGSGLRRLTREHCDQLVRLPTSGPIAQLNVSNAAAVALYELARDSTPS